MQRIDRQAAFVLHDRAFRETSALLEILTPDHGRVGLIARGIRGARPRFGRGVVVALQALEVSWQGRGELMQLTHAEPVGAPYVLNGRALLCALYVNELLTRLLARSDPQPEVHARYAELLGALTDADADAQAWALRRFERDLLVALGVAPRFDVDVHGRALDAACRYQLAPESGWIPLPASQRGDAGYPGDALLALGDPTLPSRAHLASLRQALRELIAHQLGGRELTAWRLLRG